MWDQKLFELFTTIIPQSFVFIFLLFALTGIKIEKKSYAIFSVGLAVMTFLVRPYVNFGVHSVLMLFVLVLIAVVWGKANIIASIIYGIITFGVAYFSEWITFIFLGMIKFNMEVLNSDPQIRAIIGIIPLFIFFSISLIVYYIKMNVKKKEEEKNDDIREDI